MLTGTQFYSASVLTLCGINTSIFIHQKVPVEQNWATDRCVQEK